MINNEELFINGDSENSRGFCFIENTVQMNILAATAKYDAKDKVMPMYIDYLNKTTDIN